ncbi:MAG: T9SS type A sorting domain-containing protein [Microscillaceae bacterium]|nr:T9SS type A sorting domain-containing protein [Microscillaceae bacterium]
MKALTSLFLLLSVFYLQNLQAQIAYNGPYALPYNRTEQFASVDLPAGVSVVNWTIQGAGASIQGADNARLVFFNVATASVTLTCNLSNGTNISKTIPVIPQGQVLTEGTGAMNANTTIHSVLQLLRGERFKVKPINYTGAKPTLVLVDFQGRYLAEGDSIDYRAPVRGSYYVIVNSTVAGELKVEGIRVYAPESGSNAKIDLNQPAATVGNLEAEIDRSTTHTGGESLVTLGNLVISSVYHHDLKRTFINAYQNDALQWTWQSGDNEYIRTITADATQGIAGIGSCGGAAKNQDSVLVIKLNNNGVRQLRTAFASANGIDYGYGISFLTDGALMATGFTEGNLEGLPSIGELDAFACRINPTTGSITHKIQFGSDKNDRVFASRTLANGNVLLFGDTEGRIGNVGNSLGSNDIFLTEINPNCVVVATNHYGSNENDLAFDLVIEPTSGDIFLTGMTIGNIAPQFGNVGNPDKPQVYTARINKTTKAITWLKQLGPTEGQSGETIALSNFGVGTLFYTNGSFAGANNNSLGTKASDDMVVAFFDFDGNLKFLYQFDQTTQRIFARGITFQGNNIFVLRDHAYQPDKPFITTGLDKFALPAVVTALEDDFEKNGFKIFPNPSIEILNIQNELGLEIEKITILNMQGKSIQEINLNQTPLFLNVADLPNGLYLLRLDCKQGVFVGKFLKI